MAFLPSPMRWAGGRLTRKKHPTPIRLRFISTDIQLFRCAAPLCFTISTTTAPRRQILLLFVYRNRLTHTAGMSRQEAHNRMVLAILQVLSPRRVTVARKRIVEKDYMLAQILEILLRLQKYMCNYFVVCSAG